MFSAWLSCGYDDAGVCSRLRLSPLDSVPGSVDSERLRCQRRLVSKLGLLSSRKPASKRRLYGLEQARHANRSSTPVEFGTMVLWVEWLERMRDLVKNQIPNITCLLSDYVSFREDDSLHDTRAEPKQA